MAPFKCTKLCQCQIPKCVAAAAVSAGLLAAATTEYHCAFRIGGVVLSYVLSSMLALLDELR